MPPRKVTRVGDLLGPPVSAPRKCSSDSAGSGKSGGRKGVPYVKRKSKKTFKCDECGESFTSKITYDLHWSGGYCNG